MSTNLYDYDDYRHYLKSQIKFLKESNPSMTKSKIANSFNMSLSLLKMILSGKRNLTLDSISAICRSLRMTSDQKKFFQNLVLSNQAKKLIDKKQFQRNLKKHISSISADHKITSIKNILEIKKIEFLVYLLDQSEKGLIKSFNDIDKIKISNIFSFGISDIDKYLEEFILLKLISFNNSRRLIFSFDKISHLIPQINYIKKSMTYAQSKIQDLYSRTDTFFANYTFTANEEDMNEMISELKAVFEKYSTRTYSKKETNQIIQANIQLFPSIKF